MLWRTFYKTFKICVFYQILSASFFKAAMWTTEVQSWIPRISWKTWEYPYVSFSEYIRYARNSATQLFYRLNEVTSFKSPLNVHSSTLFGFHLISLLLVLKWNISPVAAEDRASWDFVSSKDLWEDKNVTEEDDYVHVNKEDIVESIACFMAAYLLSLKETKVCLGLDLLEVYTASFSQLLLCCMFISWASHLVSFNLNWKHPESFWHCLQWGPGFSSHLLSDRGIRPGGLIMGH